MGSPHPMTAGSRWFKSGNPSPDTLPRKLGHKGIYILPTEQGFVFIVIVGAILIGSLNFNNNLGFLLSFLLGAMAFVSIIHTYKNLSGVTVLSLWSKPVFAGKKAVFELLAKADSEKALVEFEFPGVERVGGDLSPDRDGRFTMVVMTEKRGVLDPGTLTVSTRYPFGLFRAWSRIDTHTTCLVYPKPISGPYTPAKIDSLRNEDGGAAGPGVEDFQGIRAYEAGDALQRIYWKSLSKGMGLHTKSFVGSSGSAVLLDWVAIKTADPERKLSRLCDMVLKASATGDAFGLRLPGENIYPGKGDAHERKCLKALAQYRSSGSGGV